MFRARLLAALCAADLPVPERLPEKWVVQCIHVGKACRILLTPLTYVHVGKAYRILLTPLTYVHVGKGKLALKYLFCYLYRGVISENNIIANEGAR